MQDKMQLYTAKGAVSNGLQIKDRPATGHHNRHINATLAYSAADVSSTTFAVASGVNAHSLAQQLQRVTDAASLSIEQRLNNAQTAMETISLESVGVQAKEMILSMITDFAAPLDLFGNWALNLGFFAACGTLLYALVISPKQ